MDLADLVLIYPDCTGANLTACPAAMNARRISDSISKWRASMDNSQTMPRGALIESRIVNPETQLQRQQTGAELIHRLT